MPIKKPDYSSTDGEIPVIRWSNRRKMAWSAFYVLTSFTILYWFVLPLWFNWWNLNILWLNTIGDSYSWFASTMAAAIVAYLGFNSPLPNPIKRFAARISGSSNDSSVPDEQDTGEDQYYEVKTDGKSE